MGWEGHVAAGLGQAATGDWGTPAQARLLSPHSLLTGSGVGAVQVWGGWAELGPVHDPEELGGSLEGAGEGLGALGAIHGRVAQQGLLQQELLELVLHRTWARRSRALQCPCTRTLPKPTPGCLQSRGS